MLIKSEILGNAHLFFGQSHYPDDSSSRSNEFAPALEEIQIGTRSTSLPWLLLCHGVAEDNLKEIWK